LLIQCVFNRLQIDGEDQCGYRLVSIININLTNRFHVAVRLFSNRSRMTSKCGKNKKVAHEAIAECVTDVTQISLTWYRKHRMAAIQLAASCGEL